jgi:hypothetical protein
MTKAKFIRMEVRGLFDRAIVYGKYLGKDEFGNINLIPLRAISLDIVQVPKKIFGITFWISDDIRWVENKEDWKFEFGKKLCMPFNPDYVHIEFIDKSDISSNIKKVLE